jgi:hypothetical protein
MKLKNAITTYTLDIDELKAMFAETLGVEVDNIEIKPTMRAVGDCHDRYTHEVFAGVEVIVRK